MKEEGLKGTEIPINPNFPCKVIIFSIHNNIKKMPVYEATKAAWKIPEKYQNFTEYGIAVGLENKISMGAYKINKWYPCKDNNKRYEFEGEEILEFESCTWYKQIELVEAYFRYGGIPIIEFDGNGRFKILRGSKDNKDKWFNCL